VPELGTHRATAKRFKITDSGKLRHRKQSSSYLRRKKAERARCSYDKDARAESADQKCIRRIAGFRKLPNTDDQGVTA